MRHPLPLVLLAALAVFVPAGAGQAQSNTPWLPPTYQSPPNLSAQIPIAPAPGPHARATSPPPLVVPQTGQVLPNFPLVAGSGPGRRETYQDRAARCVHQAGVYGSAAGDRSSYIGACINQ